MLNKKLLKNIKKLLKKGQFTKSAGAKCEHFKMEVRTYDWKMGICTFPKSLLNLCFLHARANKEKKDLLNISFSQHCTRANN
jgi:hypothetical protein